MSLVESAAEVGRGVTIALSVLILLYSAVTSGLSMTLDLAALLVLFNVYVFAFSGLVVQAKRGWNVAAAALVSVALIAVLAGLPLLKFGFWTTAILAVVVTLGARWLVGQAAQRAIARRGQQQEAQD